MFYLTSLYNENENQNDNENENDIDKDIFHDNKIPNELLVKSCCNIHYICIRCIRKIINNYDNHPIKLA